MREYIHHIPGRLRLKLQQIKRQPARAQEVRAVICRIRGVTSVEPNVTTGSLLIRYEEAEVEADTILNFMEEAGLLSEPRTAIAGRSSPASPLADKVAGMLVEKLIERSALVLIGALL